MLETNLVPQYFQSNIGPSKAYKTTRYCRIHFECSGKRKGDLGFLEMHKEPKVGACPSFVAIRDGVVEPDSKTYL